MNDSVDIVIEETTADIKRHEGLAAEYQAMASRERSLLDALIFLTAENKQKDEVIANQNQQICIMQEMLNKLENTPQCLGDNVKTKIVNIYGQDGTNAARSFAGAM